MIIPKGTVVTIDGKVYRTLEAQVAWNKEELESLDIESLEALPDQFTELQENVSALSDSVADVTEDVGDLKSDMTDAQSDISVLKDRMTSAETNIGLNAGEISQLQFDVGQAQGDITALGNSKLDKPTNEGDVGDVIVKTANGTEFQSVAPFDPEGTYPNIKVGEAVVAKSLENVSEDSGATQTEPFFFQATAAANNTDETPTSPVFKLKSIRGNTIVYNMPVDGINTTYATISGHVYWAFHAGQPPVVITSSGTPVSFPNPQTDKLVDLTRWFNGSVPQAIIDDPSVFPENYYDGELTYSLGELKNCSCTEFKTVGFNAWDEEWELGAYDVSTGLPISSSTNIRCKNKIDVVPNTKYYFCIGNANANFWVLQYDENGNYLGNNYAKNSSITTPKNCDKIAFYVVGYGATYNHDICINISWDGERDGTYEPYVSHTYPLVWSGKSAGSAYDEKLPDGTEITRIGSVDLGSTTWNKHTINSVVYFQASLSSRAQNAHKNGICSAYVVSSGNPSAFPVDKSFSFTTYYGAYDMWIRDDSKSNMTGAEFKASLDGVTLCYELETPTTSEGTPYTSEIEGDDYGTMAFDSVVPVGNEFFYPADYALLIDDLGNYTGYDVTKLAKKTDLIPAPTGDGTYTLKAVVSGGVVTYTWEAVS